MKTSFVLIAAAIFSSAGAASASQISDIYEMNRDVFLKTPEIYEFTLCLPDQGCETFYPRELERKGGTPELLYERPKGDDATTAASAAADRIISSIGKITGVGGRVKVRYQDIKADGSSKTVDIDVTIGTGSAAAPATGNPAPLPSRPGGGGSHDIKPN